MHLLKKYLLSLWGEILIILLFLIVSNNFLTKRADLIHADGRGYYEFLPAAFIYHDLELNYLDTLQSEFYDTKLMSQDFYKRLENGKRFDKYFIGTAVLQAPFFAIGHAWAKLSPHDAADGFSHPYQISIFIAALFYTFIGLLFVRLLLTSYDVNRFWTIVVQSGVVFCTSMLDYMHWDAAYSHVYSFFLVAGFFWFARKFLLYGNRKALFATILFLGLIFLVRPVNILCVLFLPLLAKSFQQFLGSLKTVFTSYFKITIFSVITCLLIFQIQCVVWYFQTGHWMYYAYGEETFIWSEPHILDFLFSYRKGLFLWSPWLFVLVASGIIFHVLRRQWFRLVWFLCSFIFLVYVLSCWWYWSYGGSLGSRPMIDFYPALIIFAAPVFSRISGLLKWIVLLATPFLAYIMIIQTYQYQKGILTWDEMNKKDYWKVFLKTDPMYEWYLWSHKIPTGKCVSETAWQKQSRVLPDRWHIYDTLKVSIPDSSFIKVGQITFLSKEKHGAESFEIRLLDQKDSLLFNHYTTMLHVIDESRGNNFIDYRFEINKQLQPRLKAVFIINAKASAVTIDSMKIRFFSD